MSTDDTIIMTRREVEEFSFRDVDDVPTERLDDLDEVEEIDVELVVLALSGTTVIDDGLVERSFERAMDRSKIALPAEERLEALEFVRATMGRSKVEVFRELADDDEQAAHASAAFETAFAEIAEREGIEAMPGAETVIRTLRAAGVNVALITGLTRGTLDGIIEALGWGDLVDVILTADEVGRGRPYPDLPLTALLRAGGTSVEGMIVVGDSVADIESGLAAGAGVAVGVLTGAHSERALTDAGADAVIDSIADLPALLGIDSPSRG